MCGYGRAWGGEQERATSRWDLAAFALFLGGLAAPLATAADLVWRELPHIRNIPDPTVMAEVLDSIYRDPRTNFALLVVVGDSVFGNVCASSDVGGAAGVGAIGGARGATGVGGSTDVGGVEGHTRSSDVAGASGAPNVVGASGMANVAGASGATGVGGALESPVARGAAGGTRVAGATGAGGVSGMMGKIKCARTRDQLDFVLSVPARTRVLEYDGHRLYETRKVWIADQAVE